MVLRRDGNGGGKISKKPAARATGRMKLGRKPRRERDGDGVQRSGVLNLNNPLIPPEFDEDIDDDLAFNSDDEEMYGHFFTKKRTSEALAPPKARSKQNGKKPSGKRCEGEDDMGGEDNALLLQQLRALGEIDGPEDLDFHEKDDDDDDDCIDIADMLDAAQGAEDSNRGETAATRRKKKKKRVDEDGITKKRRRSGVTEEDESIYGPASGVTDSKFGSAMQEMIAAAPKTAAQSRLQRSLANKNNLISVDVDDYTKERAMREKVREVVSQDLEKYKSFLRSYHESKHIQLPMRMPESNPVPSTLGAIVAAAEANLVVDKHEGATTSATSIATDGMTGNATRTSAFRLAGKVNALLTKAGISKAQLVSEQRGDGIVPFDTNDNDDGVEDTADLCRRRGRESDAPTTSYMAKLKAMLSYENARRRRVNRIKSKTYRRILRHEKERERERREKAFELLHPEKARAKLAERLMKARVEERITQKHKNTSKWVRHAKRFAQFDEATKDAINEQHMLHDRLMRKMEEDADADAFLNAANEDGGGSEASSEEERVVDRIIADATEKLSGQEGAHGTDSSKKKLTSLLWRGVDDDVEESQVVAAANMTPTEKARAELRGMKFMQQAKEREEKRYEEVLDQIQEDIRRKACGEAVDSDDEPSDFPEDVEDLDAAEPRRVGAPRSLPAKSNASLGRLTFKKEDKEDGGKTTVKVMENIQLKRRRGIDAREGQPKETSQNNVGESSEGGDEEGPMRESGSDDEAVIENTRPAPIVKGKVDRTKPKDEFAGLRKVKTVPPPALSIDTPTPSTTGKRSISTRTTILPKVVKRPRDQSSSFGESERKGTTASNPTNKMGVAQQENSREEGDDEEALLKQQEYLIARAFAQDDVDADFLAEKTAQVTNIMKPVDKNATLPGWGEWGGSDPRLNTKHQAKLHEMELQREIQKTTLLKSRADAALDHVIINHDGVELVPDRMLLHMIPRPFSNPTEFARSMRHPYGPEWNSAISFKEANQPRVEVRQGHVVAPLDLSLRGKKVAKTKRRKGEITTRV